MMEGNGAGGSTVDGRAPCTLLRQDCSLIIPLASQTKKRSYGRNGEQLDLDICYFPLYRIPFTGGITVELYTKHKELGFSFDLLA